VKASTSVGETAKDVDYIVTSVPATWDVEDLLKKPDGIF
jgi:3-hydroxyisobutyrate dehydrogenase-like beta-hydroxyacid dehydrogenase